MKAAGGGAAWRRRGLGGHPLELQDQVLVVAGLLGLIALELVEQDLDPVDGGQDQR